MRAISFAICSLVLGFQFASRFSLGEFLSFGVAQTICNSQQEFVDTGQPADPVKERPNNQVEKCLWYERNPDCSSGSNCLSFASKTCKELGLPENQISSSKITPKIVGGKEVEPPHKYPSYVRMLRKDIDNKTNETLEDFGPTCGSVILSKDWLLTAAHCDGIDTESEEYRYEYKYLAGRHDFTVPEDDEQFVKPIERLRPPNVSDSTGFYSYIDMVLIKVNPPLQFNDHISAVKLPTKSYNVPGEMAVLMGVGAYAAENPFYYDLPDVPKEAELPVIDRETCKKIYSEEGTDPRDINEYKICFHKDGGSAGSCFIDSGSPSYKLENGEQILIGIASEVTSGNCSGKSATSIYMDVFNLIDWIRETTGISE